jgi:hypothetical protein
MILLGLHPVDLQIGNNIKMNSDILADMQERLSFFYFTLPEELVFGGTSE